MSPKKNGTFVLCSVQYHKQPKFIDRYDIEKLFTTYRDNRFFNYFYPFNIKQYNNYIF